MATGFVLITPRDLDLFRALDYAPLTVEQLLALSETFAAPFQSKRRLWARLQALTKAGHVRRFLYATTGPGVIGYYTLSPEAFQLLHGHKAKLPGRRSFAAVSLSRQRHTRCLADFLVKTLVAAHRTSTVLSDYARENELRLTVGEDSCYPDCAFTLTPPGGGPLRFYVEFDNCTERVRSHFDADSWERKLLLHNLLQYSSLNRFRVLAVTTGTEERLQHILGLAATTARNPKRNLLYGVTLGSYLRQEHPLSAPCFLNHHSQPVALIQPYGPSRSAVAQRQAEMVRIPTS